jgi:ligand-binding sensor domain-containing protein
MKIIKGVHTFILLIFSLFFSTCEKDSSSDKYPEAINFDISYRLLSGRKIACLDINQEGDLCAGSDNKLILIDRLKDQKIINLDYEITDVAMAQDGSVWAGTNGGGLARINENGIRYYNSVNSGLPRDYVSEVEIAPDGKVWFTSCAFNIGGLGIYDGRKFEFLTPENSPLNQNIIFSLDINSDGVVYLATSGKVGRTNIYRITGRRWECLGDEGGTFYWVFSFDAGPSGLLYLIEDFSLSSAFHTTNNLYELHDDKWKLVDLDNISGIGFSARVALDRRNYCWIADHKNGSIVLNVYNGRSWESSLPGTFPDDFITTIKVDHENNIWLGTYQNGIIVLNQ